MPQAIGDPDELNRFAQSLSQFVETMSDAVNSLNHSFSALGDTWQDEKRMRFEEEYALLLKQLSSFESFASSQVVYLNMLAARLSDYLQS